MLPVLAGLAVAPALAHAQEGGFPVGVEVGVFYPTDRATRDAFGDTWYSFGIKPLSVSRARGRSLDTDFDVTGRSANGNRLTIVRLTVGYKQALGDPRGSSVPYAAVRVGPSYVDYAITRNNVRTSERRLGAAGNIELGVVFNDRLRLSTRYDLMQEFDGFNFNGLSFNVAYQVFRF